MFFELSLANETPEESRAIAAGGGPPPPPAPRRDGGAVRKILASDLEMWFHGPPPYQFLARILSGDASAHFEFRPYSISAVGSMVFAEGYDGRRSITWIHAWTVGGGGVITHVREYFNTSLTVTRIEATEEWDSGSSSGRSSSSSSSSLHCPSVWESTLAARVGKSVPGLVLAI